MNGLVITTDDRMYVQEFQDNIPLYKSVGTVVGGWIQIVSPKNLPCIYVLICNEEGLLQRLPQNLTGCLMYDTITHGWPIVGNIVLMKHGTVNGEPDIIGLNDDDIKFLKDLVQAMTCDLVKTEASK